MVIVLGIGDLMLHARQILTRDYKLLPFFIAAIIYLLFLLLFWFLYSDNWRRNMSLETKETNLKVVNIKKHYKRHSSYKRSIIYS
ncbi:hypothetical protein OGZ02_11420 [Brachyspira hyodysenteriae]|nr:hypothetical protein [Brachyspira hyodysenteriae]